MISITQEIQFSTHWSSAKPPRYLCFRHAVKAAILGDDIECKTIDGDDFVYCSDCKEERGN